MPHILLEYSDNIAENLKITSLLDTLHKALGDFETFDNDRIKSRAVKLDTYIVGAAEGGDAFIHATVSFSRGRSSELRKEIGDHLRKLVTKETQGNIKFKTTCSVEIRQFEEEMYFYSFAAE